MFTMIWLLSGLVIGGGSLAAAIFAQRRRAGLTILGALAALGGAAVLLFWITLPADDAGRTSYSITQGYYQDKYGGTMVGLLFIIGSLFLPPLFYALLRQPMPDRPRRTDLPPPDRATPRPAVRPAGPRRCPDCGADLPANAPEGLCPRCLLGPGLARPSPTPPPAAPQGTTPYPGPFTAPVPADLASHFPHLEILELIGQGGMGAVYKARQTKLDRIVALKVLPPEWGTDPAFAERFAREARALARLSHPHIVAVHDFGEAGGLYYLLMEFVDGVNLRQALQAGPLPAEQALAVIPQICDALQYAHEEGIVHRDVKPENILLDRRGRVKIADFGLAKLLGGPRVEFTLTGSRQVMGTLDYMAPEQRSRPLEIDHRADLYSLGVVFYEMLTGELPLGRFAPPSERSGVDARLDGVVHRALETDPERRYQSAGDVKADVDSVVGTPGSAASPAGQPEGDRGQVVLAAALHQVQGPATGLLVAGVLTPLAWALGLAIMAVLDPRWLTERMAWRVTPLWLIPFDVPFRPVPCVVYFLFSLGVGGVLIAAGRKMRRCEAYELALIGSILALTPLPSLAWLVSLPMGLWALLVLCKREMRAGFVLRAGGNGRAAVLAKTVRTPKATGPVRRKVRSFFNSVLAMFVSRPGKGYPVEGEQPAERS